MAGAAAVGGAETEPGLGESFFRAKQAGDEHGLMAAKQELVSALVNLAQELSISTAGPAPPDPGTS